VRLSRRFSVLAAFAVAVGTLAAQRPANANANYQQLRSLLPAGEVITVHNLQLKRDAATFDFRNGSIAFYGEVNGKVTGAVFRGDGHLHITPPTAEERHNLSLTMNSQEFDEEFDEAVLRFTDGTAAELHAAATGKGQLDGSFTKDAQDLQNFLRHHAEGSGNQQGTTLYFKKLYGNLDLRLLEDVASPAPGGYFLAAVHGHKNSHLYFIVDPHGVDGVAPEEVALLRWDTSNDTETIPLAFHSAAAIANGTATSNEQNATYKILHENLDVSIEKSGFLTCTATVQLRAQEDRLAVVPLDLYPTLRVSSVQSEKGDALDWVQEDKSVDPDFGVVLPAPLKKGETTTIKVAYGGKDVVLNEGQGNYYPIAREDWYPNGNQGFGSYATFDMTFHTPKGLDLIATGTRQSQEADGKVITSVWKSETPLPVVGFSLGDFAQREVVIGKPPASQMTVDAYANKQKPDFLNSITNAADANGPGSGMDSPVGALGTLDTTPLLANELNQGAMAAQIYTSYFGPLPFAHIALTQQSACDYGQSWPMLVYLPICGFFDTTQQHFLGIGGENFRNYMYWKVVTPHEVAHQWWGQTVGFQSYRDQWMSEGFADCSASIFLQSTSKTQAEYLHFWKQEQSLITQKNEFGFRPIDVGPVTMGTRLSSPKAGWNIYGDLVYPKGAYILQMIRLMMWTPKDGDARFKETMQDFVNTYRLRPATTEDFKAMVEKHMSPSMNLDGNGRMDWFFNEYVYGTELPTYHFEGETTPSGDGTALHLKLTQSGVSPQFKMPVPVYLELADGHILRFGEINMVGSSTFEHTFNLPKMPTPIKKVSINYYYDVLSVEN
jgi:hypothetical protein